MSNSEFVTHGKTLNPMYLVYLQVLTQFFFLEKKKLQILTRDIACGMNSNAT